jgi:pimeloyl-ACP methyl ester carboxylesterase/phosphatidylglycerophosphate synthase
MANLLTLARVLLIFIVIAVWGRDRGVESPWLDLAMVPVLAWAIIMDALDGWAARKFHEESKAGALFDIAGDRIVELTLWTFFAIRRDPAGVPLVPYWVPLVIITRTVLTDLIRSVAFADGKTPFGENTLQSTAWAKWLTSSAISRGGYGVLKTLSFCGLGFVIALPRLVADPAWIGGLRQTIDVLVYVTTAFAILRAVPVIWDGRRYLRGGSATGATALLVAFGGLTAAPSAQAQDAPTAVAAALAPDSSRFITARGVSIHYLESRPAVAGEPWLLLIHGFGASVESWYDVAPLLAPEIRTVRLDLRGFGRSAKPRDTLYTLEEQAAIIGESLPMLGAGPVILAGHSYGGGVAWISYLRLMNAGRAGEVAGLILMDAASYPQELPFFVTSLRAPVSRFFAERFTTARWRTRFTLERIFVRTDRIDDARVERYAKSLRQKNAEYAIAMVARQVEPPNVETLADSIRSFDVPALVVWGEHDPVIPVDFAHRLHAALRGSELVIIPGIGHVPQEEEPELTARALLAFIDRVRKGSPPHSARARDPLDPIAHDARDAVVVRLGHPR